MVEVETDDGQFSRKRFWIANAWIGIATLYALITAFSYRGLYSFLAEIQFSWIDRYFPVATALLIVGVLSLPLLLIFWFRKRRHKDQMPEQDEIANEAEALWRRRLLSAWLAGLCAIAVFYQLATIINLPSEDGQTAEFSATDIAAGFDDGLEMDGPARINGGTIRTDIVSYLEDGILFSGLNRKFAPVQAAALPETAPITLFLEVKVEEGEAAPFQVISEGVLQRKAIPPEIRSLYRSQGLNVSSDAFVLYEDSSTMLIRPLLYGGAALLLLVIFAFIARSARRKREKLLSSSNLA